VTVAIPDLIEKVTVWIDGGSCLQDGGSASGIWMFICGSQVKAMPRGFLVTKHCHHLVVWIHIEVPKCKQRGTGKLLR